MLLPEARGIDDVPVLCDVLDDRLDRLLRVAQLSQRARDRLVDDLHRPAADELLELDEREVRLDARRVAVHHETDRAGRGEHAGLGVAPAVDGTEVDPVLPFPLRAVEDGGIHRAERLHGLIRSGMLAHDPLVRGGIPRKTCIGTHDSGQLG